MLESVTTYCQASYLLSGKATYCQASYLLSGKLSAVMKLAPNFRIHAPKRFRIQTTYCQAKLPTVRQSYLQSGKATYCQACTQT